MGFFVCLLELYRRCSIWEPLQLECWKENILFRKPLLRIFVVVVDSSTSKPIWRDFSVSFQYFQYSSVFSAFLVRSFFPFSICSFASQAQTLDCIQNRVTFVRSCSHVRWKFFLFAPSHFYNFPKK